MIEVLFRGKQENGKWLYGDLINHKKENRCAITPQKGGMTDYKKYEVIPETVRQYTGMKDQNGVKIFEGDIILFEGDKYTVKWFAFDCCFILVQKSRMCLNLSMYRDLEVIGNIHDNKDLLI